MKIVKAEVFVTCPGRNFVTLKITTEDGITGLGDATLNGRELSDFRLYREISDGKSITYMIAGLNKEYGDVVESGLLFADPAVVDRETDELIEKAIAFKLAYRQQYQQKAGWNYESSFC